MAEDDTHSRLSSWSKRKLAVAKEAEVDDAEAMSSDDVVDVEAEAALAEEHEVNRLAAESIDLETMDENTDFSVFMKDGVPDLLKKSAMAVLWRSNPIFANVDGLVDYDDDFGSPDLIMKTFKSAYQVGKGYLDKVEEEETETTDQLTAEQANYPDDDNAEDSEALEDELAVENEQEPEEVSDEILEDEPQSETTELEIAEASSGVTEEPAPKVSLRSRLMLDS